MSKTIDNRIVQMQFDNQQFEQGVKTSMHTIDQLDEKLQFKNSKNGAGAINNISEALLGLTNKFSNIGIIGMTVVQRLTNSLLNKILPAFGRVDSIISSMTLNMSTLMTSFSKYEQMITNQQTIMSSVQDKINSLTNEAYTMEDVANIIERLRWYTDETSYNLDQMVNAIGNFTASGIDLAASEYMIVGIANACAEAGINAQKADIAFNGFSKAIGNGYVNLATWNNQLKTSGITNSEKFRQSLLDAAEAEGTLIRLNGRLMTLDGAYEVTLSNLTETLTEYGWANTNVLNRVLYEYSNTVSGIHQLTESGELDLSAEAFDTLREAMEKSGKTLSDLGLDKKFDQASEAIRALKNAYEELGLEVPKSLRTFGFAQEAVTWSQVLEATSTAVRSSWSKTFELLFGNYEEAKRLWTDVSETMWDIFAGGASDRNDILQIWHDNSYETFAEGVNNAFIAIDNLANAFRSLFKQLFSDNPDLYIEKISSALVSMTDSISRKVKGITDFTESIATLIDNLYLLEDLRHLSRLYGNLKSMSEIMSDIEGYSKVKFDWLSSEEIDNIDSLLDKFGDLQTIISKLEIIEDIRNTFKGFVAVLDLAKQAISGFWRALEPIRSLFGRIAADILDMSGSFGEWLVALSESAKETDFFYREFKKVIDFIAKFANPTFDFLSESFKNIVKGLSKVKDFIVKLLSGISDLFGNISLDWVSGSDFLVAFLDYLAELFKATAKVIKEAATAILDSLKEITGTHTIKDLVSTIVTTISALALAWTTYEDSNPFDFIIHMFDSQKISSIFSSIALGFKALTRWANTKTISEISKAILTLAGALFVMSLINPDRLSSAVVAMGALFAELSLSLSYISNTKLGSAINIVPIVTSLSIALLVLSFALANIAAIKSEDLFRSLVGIGVLFAEIVIAINNIQAVKTKGIFSFALGMLVLAAAVKVLSAIDTNGLVKGVLAIGFIMLELATFFGLMDKFAKYKYRTKAASKAVMTMSVAMLVLSAALTVLSKIDPDKLADGLLTMGTAMLMFTAAALVLGSGNAIKGASALMIMAVAMLALTPSLMLLGSMKLSSIGKMLLTLAGVFTVFGVAAFLLQPIIPIMYALAGAIALLGIGLVGIGAGITLFSIGLTALSTAVATSGTAIVTAIEIIITGLFDAIGQAIVSFVKNVSDLAAEIANAFIKIGKAILSAIEGLIPQLVNTIMIVVNAILEALTVNMPILVDNIVKLIISCIKSLTNAINEHGKELIEAIGGLLAAIWNFVVLALQELISTIPVFGDELAGLLEGLKIDTKETLNPDEAAETGRKFGESLADGVSTSVIEKTPGVESAITDLRKSAVDSFDMSEDFSNSAYNAIDGFTNTLWNRRDSVISAAASIGRSAARGLRSALDEHSPSKVFAEIGDFATQGFVQGITNSLGSVSKATTEMGNRSIAGMNSAISRIGDAISTDSFQNQPVIRPVLDLSDVNSGADQMRGILGDNYNLALSGSVTSRRLSNSIEIQNRGSAMADAIASLKDDFRSMTDEIMGMRIVMDSGALVGSVAPKMDKALGTISTYKGRGNTY